VNGLLSTTQTHRQTEAERVTLGKTGAGAERFAKVVSRCYKARSPEETWLYEPRRVYNSHDHLQQAVFKTFMGFSCFTFKKTISGSGMFGISTEAVRSTMLYAAETSG
jgi:hypothetical protein